MSPGEAGVPNLAANLNYLFETVPQENGSPYTNTAVEREIYDRTQGSVRVSASYIGQMRSGREKNPTASKLRELSITFGVPVDFWWQPSVTQEVKDQFSMLVAARDAKLRGIMARAHGVSDEGLSGLLTILDGIRASEALSNRSKSSTEGDRFEE
ncbi:MAG: hypothetical protein M3Y49_19155 [Actinomycetota bacterium]|nr:hypothetical protein [Actinomycetota bacterium]